jgi:multicomponent Na+:H+ antiporter subunit E
MARGLNIVLLALVWTAMTGSFSLLNIAFGLLLGSVMLFLLREQTGARASSFHVWRVLLLLALFVKELVLSALRVAKLVMSPTMVLKPGIFAYALKVDRDFEITLLANLITLTPGTLSVDISEDRRFLFVHAIDCSDPDQARREIEYGFERRIMEAFR